MAFTYFVYGLRLLSNLPIPGLTEITSALPPDVCVHLQSNPQTGKFDPTTEQLKYVTPYQDRNGADVLHVWEVEPNKSLRFDYSDGMQFIVAADTYEVWATWPSTLTVDDAAIYLLGPILGIILRLRGVICLHASAVSLGDQAVAFVGPAGFGKSTTAALFAQQGHSIMCDDLVALSCKEQVFVQSAYPRLRLWPSAVNFLYGSPDALPKLVDSDPLWDKCYLDLVNCANDFQIRPLPLAAIYILEQRSEHFTAPTIEDVTANDALISLVANTYANYFLDKKMRSAEFKTLARIVSEIPIRRLVPHADPQRLPDLYQAVVNDFAQVSTRNDLLLPQDASLRVFQ